MKKSKHWLHLETIRRLIRKDAIGNLKNLLTRLHIMDIAGILGELSPRDMYLVFRNLETDEIRAEVLSGMDQDRAVELIEQIDSREAGLLLRLMAPDDAAVLLNHMPEDKVSVYQQQMTHEELNQVEDLLTYPEETAGRIMTQQVFALKQDVTVRTAMKQIHSAERAETVFYLYVVDDSDRLSGVVSLRRLILEDADTVLKDIMLTNVITVSPELDQEEVAHIVARYDLLAVPVVDESGFLLGIVTVDDVIDIIHEEAREDIYRLAGSNLSEYDMKSPLKMSGVRLKWLSIRLVGSVLAGAILFYLMLLNQTLFPSSLAWTAFLLPMYMSLTGGIGTQSSTIVSEQLALRSDQTVTFWSLIKTEFIISLIMGLFMGLAPALLLYLTGVTDLTTAVFAGGFLWLGLLVSAMIGSVLPFVFSKLNRDPTLVSGSLIGSMLDVVGILFFVLHILFVTQYLI